MKANKIDFKKLENALRSDIMDKYGEANKFKMIYVVYAFHKDYSKTSKPFQGAFEASFIEYDTAQSIFKSLKKDKNFEEIQLRAYGYYGSNIHEGNYDILEISRPDGSYFRLDVYDAA